MSISTSETLKLFNECVRIGKEASKIEANLFSLAKESNTCMAIIIEAKDKELKQLNLIRELGLKGVYEYWLDTNGHLPDEFK